MNKLYKTQVIHPHIRHPQQLHSQSMPKEKKQGKKQYISRKGRGGDHLLKWDKWCSITCYDTHKSSAPAERKSRLQLQQTQPTHTINIVINTHTKLSHRNESNNKIPIQYLNLAHKFSNCLFKNVVKHLSAYPCQVNICKDKLITKFACPSDKYDFPPGCVRFFTYIQACY